MSFNLAVWEGARPGTASDAVATFRALYGKYMDDSREEPTRAIKDFIAEVTAEYPDITDLPDEKVDDGVWSDGPLIDNASGPLFYFGIVSNQMDGVRMFVARIAAERGLVCFDPQSGDCVRLD